MQLTTLTVFIISIVDVFASPITARTCPRPQGTIATKRGLSYNNADFAALFDFEKINWAYNWGQTPNGLSSDYDYVPLIWGTEFTPTWMTNAQTAIDSGSTYLLGFNEPDVTGQANLDPDDAVNLWMEYMEPFACSVLLGAPAVTNGPDPMGLTWLENFLTACVGCTIDFIPIHWYNPATEIEDFQNQVQQAYNLGGGLPIWITEFGFIDSSEDEITAFLTQILPWLDSLDWVQRYSYFMADNNIGMLPLIDVTGTLLSSVGITYNGV